MPKCKLFKISSFKTTTPSQSRNCSKSVLSRPPHHCKVETVQNYFFQGTGLTPPYVWASGHPHMFGCSHAFRYPLMSPDAPNTPICSNTPCMSPMLPCAYPICYFKTTTPSQRRNCSKSVLSRPPHLHKVETVQNQFFQDHHTFLK